jgi:trehalose/maltose hydrolase-like predicted phosphorylase
MDHPASGGITLAQAIQVGCRTSRAGIGCRRLYLGGFSMNDFTLVYDSFIPEDEGLREALTSTGNGYFCTRGAAEWEDAHGVHYPGTYAHGAYNRETTILGGRPVLNEDLVNLPNWLVLKLIIEGEETMSVSNVEHLSYRHELDVRAAVVTRELSFRDRAGRETTLRSRRFVSMAHVHQAAIEWTLTPENWSGRMEVITALDGRVTNRGVARYRQLEGRHLDPVSPRTFGAEVIALKVQTRQSNLYVAEAARTRVYRDEQLVDVERNLYQMEDYIQQVLAFDVREGERVQVEKMVAFYTSHDRAISETLGSAGKSVARYPRFAEALARHRRAWEELWEVCDLRLPGNQRVQLLLRLHISHILQVCSRHTADLDAGVPARGLNGEAYRGHVFWDELYVYPFLSFRLPDITRELLMYRYRRLGEARSAAREAGFGGAMFPWQSGSDGEEETQTVHLNPLSGQWEADLSHNQRHVNAAIFYNVWSYYEATADLAFLRDYGAEMMLEITRFWASIAHFNPERDRYEIHGVMGPDEFHEKYPGAAQGGLRNNAYTNVMVAWSCETAGKVLELLPESRRQALQARLGLSDEEIVAWQRMSREMFVPFHGDGIISQFEGYEDLQELDWDAYRHKYGNVQRLDRILRAEGDDPDHYKLAKQADTVMLFFLFPERELRRLFERLGYSYQTDTARKNIDYYDRRTSHGSTLSFITHAGALAAIEPESSWERFMVALESDVGDVQGGTTKEGIHMGVMSGTLDLIQRGYVGSEIRDGVLYFDPKLADRLNGLSFAMQFRGTPIRVTLTRSELTVVADAEGFSRPVRVGVGDDVRELQAGERWAFPLNRETSTAR